MLMLFLKNKYLKFFKKNHANIILFNLYEIHSANLTTPTFEHA